MPLIDRFLITLVRTELEEMVPGYEWSNWLPSGSLRWNLQFEEYGRTGSNKGPILLIPEELVKHLLVLFSIADLLKKSNYVKMYFVLF